MKKTNLVICTLLVSTLSVPALAANTSSSWNKGKSDAMTEVEQRINNQQYEAAIHDLKGIVAKDTDNADAYNLLGYTHRKLKRYEVAEDYYQRALALDPDHRGAMEYLGELYVETQRRDEANAMLSRLDKACFFGCEEYRKLKAMIDNREQRPETVSKW